MTKHPRNSDKFSTAYDKSHQSTDHKIWRHSDYGKDLFKGAIRINKYMEHSERLSASHLSHCEKNFNLKYEKHVILEVQCTGGHRI